MASNPDYPAYEIFISTEADRQISQIKRRDRHAAEQIADAILDLAYDPYPPNSVRMRDFEDLRRLKDVHQHRIIYRVLVGKPKVVIDRVLARGIVYKGLDRENWD